MAWWFAEKLNDLMTSFNNTKIAFRSKTDRQLKYSYRLFKLVGNNTLVRIGPLFLALALKLRLPIISIIKKTIFKHFCGGENIKDCEKTTECYVLLCFSYVLLLFTVFNSSFQVSVVFWYVFDMVGYVLLTCGEKCSFAGSAGKTKTVCQVLWGKNPRNYHKNQEIVL